LLLLLELEPPPPFCCGALADDFFDDFFFEDFFFLVFFFFVFFVAFFSGAAGFSTAFGAALAAGFRAPGSRNFGEVIDPGTDPELDVHGGPPIMPHACASRISLFAEVVRTSKQAITLSTSTRPHISEIFIPDHPAVAHCATRENVYGGSTDPQKNPVNLLVPRNDYAFADLATQASPRTCFHSLGSHQQNNNGTFANDQTKQAAISNISRRP
jgi:hypothetical protein